MNKVTPTALLLAVVASQMASQAQAPGGRGGAAAGPAPTHANLDYAPPNPPTSNGHRLDLYVPSGAGPFPVVIWSGGSAWMRDNGKDTAGRMAGWLLPMGYAVAGVSIRSSDQVTFPGQLHDMKAAVRWLRANAARFSLDPERIAISGDSSGGWTAAMTALTGDVPELEGTVGTTGVPSTVQAAVVFYPPTNFVTMDAWALAPCGAAGAGRGCIVHDADDSPESRLVGCAIQTCPDRVAAANPARYISPADPPLLILHGNSDQLVPHNQGEQLYMALNKACHDATFISLPRGRHGPWFGFLTDDTVRVAATRRSTSSTCEVTNPEPYTPSWQTVFDFLDRTLRP